MNEQLNVAVAEAIKGGSPNHYLNAILHGGKIKAPQDFANYVAAEFWGRILDQAPNDPVRTMDSVIRDLAKTGDGSKALEQIDAELEGCFGETAFGDSCYDFADAMRDEVGQLMLAVKYLVAEQARVEQAA